MLTIRIIPVIDLKAGQVVRGIAGRRAEYRPIVSRLVASADPLEVAQAFRAQLGLQELYLADLDAIAGGELAMGLYQTLQQMGFRLWVDAGVRDLNRATALSTAGVARIVLGLETVPGLGALAEIVRQLGPERAVFSLDLHNGTPLGDRTTWGRFTALDVATEVIELGIRRVIVLDLARVGVGGGTGTETLCQRLRERYPQLEIIAGGGVRGIEDLERLEQIGVSATLVASALHDGRIGREQLPRNR